MAQQLPAGSAALSHEIIVTVVEPKLYLDHSGAVFDFKLRKCGLLIHLQDVADNFHLQTKQEE